ncbi:putative 2,5-dichlorohydroquinone reductive dechlorinase [Octadecabacter antarcticus 307]|uniref:Putative 2,5-dichlorohydroquinone reductive dechlorinase n=1 Tax=Octadecabacter antarcticus 307 TaxID=391626 RepID=M9RE22_9RHOB|nr:glutathione S-transferase family protein [Octadecabacter antarcticus]AGI68666.1 putative 2,5-dichlorohydroquinone reductive dechlorinase [Octadecabacter antarcticus 307]
MQTHSQTSKIDTHTLTKSARISAVGDASRRTIISPDAPTPTTPRDEAGPDPQIELFHFVMSICSQKSRVSLIEAGQTFGSNELVIMPPLNENYNADYVALRMASPLARAESMVSSYSGATGTTGEGFDPLVVPTLVDHDKGEVVADSRLIALYANDLSDGKLIPDAEKAAVMAEVDAVDALPHAGLFYGANPDGDHRPPPIQAGMKDAHLRKIEQVKKHRDALPDGSPLRQAYDQKLIKEDAGRKFIHDPVSMKNIIATTKSGVDAFAKRLSNRSTSWSVSNDFTLADIFWGVSLFRLTYLGYAWMWNEHPHLAEFAKQTYARPSLRAGAIDWPGHPPGDTIADII